MRRYSESRRLHPLSRRNPDDPQRALVDAIELERELLATLREQAQVIDTGALRTAQLQRYVIDAVALPVRQLTLVFESFAFKRGVPLDADYVFDVRMLPNPHYEPALRELTGLDAPVAAYLSEQPDVQRLYADIEGVFAPLDRPARAQPAQLRDGGDRLHRRPAPLGLSGAAARRLVCCRLADLAAASRTRRATGCRWRHRRAATIA